MRMNLIVLALAARVPSEEKVPPIDVSLKRVRSASASGVPCASSPGVPCMMKRTPSPSLGEARRSSPADEVSRKRGTASRKSADEVSSGASDEASSEASGIPPGISSGTPSGTPSGIPSLTSVISPVTPSSKRFCPAETVASILRDEKTLACLDAFFRRSHPALLQDPELTDEVYELIVLAHFDGGSRAPSSHFVNEIKEAADHKRLIPAEITLSNIHIADHFPHRALRFLAENFNVARLTLYCVDISLALLKKDDVYGITSLAILKCPSLQEIYLPTNFKSIKSYYQSCDGLRNTLGSDLSRLFVPTLDDLTLTNADLTDEEVAQLYMIYGRELVHVTPAKF